MSATRWMHRSASARAECRRALLSSARGCYLTEVSNTGPVGLVVIHCWTLL